MNGLEIEQILYSHLPSRGIFQGVYSCNNLPNIDPCSFPCGFIINTDENFKPGEHWVTVYFSSNSSIPEYFDSYGLPPIKADFYQFLHKNSNNAFFRYSTHSIQSLNSTTCGHYAIYFLINRIENKSFQSIVSSFTVDTFWNDKFIKNYIRKLKKLSFTCG